MQTCLHQQKVLFKKLQTWYEIAMMTPQNGVGNTPDSVTFRLLVKLQTWYEIAMMTPQNGVGNTPGSVTFRLLV